MRLITAPEKYEPKNDDVCVFLGGGITNCPNWQQEVIDKLSEFPDSVVVFNPRRDNFPIDDPNAAEEQIKWEFDALEDANVFTMYFCDSPSDQPICMYELGRNILRMFEKYPDLGEDQIVVSVEEGYKRKNDVMIQADLAGFFWTECMANREALINSHVERIKEMTIHYLEGVWDGEENGYVYNHRERADESLEE